MTRREGHDRKERKGVTYTKGYDLKGREIYDRSGEIYQG
jgi:hypothetical protein